MPPARGDHEARRRDVSEAVWGVLADSGFGGLTLRAVAARMGASTGLLTHYFPSKQALVAHALEILDQRRERSRIPDDADRPPGLAELRRVLLEILPLTPDSAAENRVWVSSWDVSLADPDLALAQAERYRRSRARLRDHAAVARAAGELPRSADPELLAAAAMAFVHGLVVQALFDPAAFPPERQTALLDDFLGSLRARG
ncbi:TetR/AcrR family transcriptional regulator [Streptacidiphilus sp. P02-A3a]|uniref:TetR/AcrR family transcriptional regulator n=1 Tax=Streptacidiphilus sp. P02-A3a TaxID=2704468 RepID=UPI0015FA512D|nr:TetR/AcrR family transcriptional regulator [Streptacidiphilus sp. P02-A3a]QMU69730.1 TetR family transcriptional regulator [Streptacidiphilus sp. P02-A3a]